MKQTITSLRERWSDKQLRTLDHQLAAAARSTAGAVPDSPFGVTADGLADFRGATLSESVRYLLGVRRVDFSRVAFESGASITDAELEDCVLDGIDMCGGWLCDAALRCSEAPLRYWWHA